MASEDLKILKKQVRSMIPFVEEYLKNATEDTISIGNVSVTVEEMEAMHAEFKRILEMAEPAEIKRDIIPLKLNTVNHFFDQINASIVRINRALFMQSLN